jgi:hypothetical protein
MWRHGFVARWKAEQDYPAWPERSPRQRRRRGPRTSRARLCHLAGGELYQIQSLLGHVSIPTDVQIKLPNDDAHDGQRGLALTGGASAFDL